LFDIAKKLVHILWEVDYRTFTSEDTTGFAKKHYESAYLADYLEDTETNAGVVSVQEEELVSHVLLVEDLGERTERLDGETYTVQRVRAVVQVERFRPKDPKMSFFEEGKSFTMLYDVYFIEEQGVQKIAEYGFEPEGEEFLPAGEKEPLPQEGREQIGQLVIAYLDTRYNIAADSFSVEQQWDFYSQNLSEWFLERDDISRESLEQWGEELSSYHVSIALGESVIEIGQQKKYVNDGESGHFYYWAEASYSYTVEADQRYFALKGIEKIDNVRERLYFDRGENGKYRLMWAEYLEQGESK